jgi:hypothetical protein
MSANKLTDYEESLADVQRHAATIEYFDTHDLGDELEAMPEVEFKIDLSDHRSYFRLEHDLSGKVQQIARQRGVSAETLLNLWVQEKAAEILTVGATE